MLYRHTMVVEGSGVFPLDMLRYDACYPSNQADVEQIHASVVRESRTYLVTVVQLNDQRRPRFTAGRWASFGARAHTPHSTKV